MAGQALRAGTTHRRRALFGLLDGDGWSWASLKAVFWFIVIIFLLGYIPDRAYYFTVFSTIDLGINAISPINLCPPINRNLPCPAPVGAVVPWDPSPTELALPAARVDGAAVQAGTKILYIGGTDGQTASDKVFVADAFTSGNFSAWTEGPALPAPRSKPGVAFLGGSIYVVGGYDDQGKATTSVFVLTPDAATGVLPAWQTAADAKLPIDLNEPRAAGALVATGDGLLLVGGVDASGQPTNTVWKATLEATGKLGAWKSEVPIVIPVAGGNGPAPRADATAVFSGTYVYVFGGRDASGPTATVLRGDVGTGDTAGQVIRWGAALGSGNLPAARTDAAGFSANGGLYVLGGSDGTSLHNELYWAVPDDLGNIPEWKHLSASDLPPPGLAGGSAVVSGSNVFVVGGKTDQGILSGSVRANLAPQSPFFQLGLIGATIPALKIDGEVGQQLGYLAAAGAGTLDFAILVVIGWAYAHKERTRELFERLRNRRKRAET